MTQRIPTRLQLTQLRTYFSDGDASLIRESIWGMNRSMCLQAINGKTYQVSYVCKDFGREWILLKVVKRDKQGNIIN